VTGVLLVTAFVVIEKVTVDLPPGTVTDAGTTTDVLALLSETTLPREAAKPFSATVQETDVPPFAVVGVVVMLRRLGGLTVNV
jgi:hypothetical protein